MLQEVAEWVKCFRAQQATSAMAEYIVLPSVMDMLLDELDRLDAAVKQYEAVTHEVAKMLDKAEALELACLSAQEMDEGQGLLGKVR